ncbi:hypothetical protein D3C80_1270460 [compost metagenome]
MLSPAGIDISGPLVRINSGGSPGAVATTAKNALKQLFPALKTTLGKVTHVEGSDSTPDYHDSTAPLNAVERLKQNPIAFVDAHAAGIAPDAGTAAQASSNTEQQAQSQALRNAARSGQPFVEH